MRTATVQPLPSAEPVDKMINRTIRALLAIRDMDPETFRAETGIAKSTYYNRMSGRNGWTAADVKRAADVLSVSVSVLYDGLDVGDTGETSNGVTRKYPDEGAVIIPFPLPLAA